jgi:hypothetical protein
MAVVAGVVFFAVRALLALIPALTVSFPIKKWSAAAALAAAAFYLLLSGAEVATQRSFIASLRNATMILDPLDVSLSPGLFSRCLFFVDWHQSSGSHGALTIATGRSLAVSPLYKDCCVSRIERISLMMDEVSLACIVSK